MSDAERKVIHEVNTNTEDYDGRKDVYLERTFRFRNLAEFTALTTRERSRISKAQKEREEYEKYWKGVKQVCTCQFENTKTTPTKASIKMYYSGPPEPPFKSPKNLSSPSNGETLNRKVKEVKTTDGNSFTTRSGKKRNAASNRDDSLKANNLEKRNKKPESKKTIRSDNTSEHLNEDIKSLDDIIASHSITDFLNLD